MSLIAIGMNLLLAGLLVAAMAVGLRLNRRLQALRDSHAGFEAAVRDLNVAAARAEQGLADLRAATDEATDLLSDRIEKGRALAGRLEKLVAATPPAAPLAAEPPTANDSAERRLGALLAAARAVRGQPEARPPAPEPLVGRPPLPGRRISSPDEDLFEDAPLNLDRRAGARW
jgi:hypothetical protein